MFVATLVADSGLDESFLAEVAHQFDMDRFAGRLHGKYLIEDERAGEFMFGPSNGFDVAQCGALAEDIQGMAWSIATSGFRREMAIDVIVQLQGPRQKKLLIADMDSTMITCECIDELADYAGIKPQIAAITERAMRGELEFEAALRERVALLKGLSEDVIEQCLRERVKIMPGAKELIAAVKDSGGYTVLVSGGFTRFAEPVGREIGFDRVIANTLGIKDGVLDGTVVGEIVGAETKKAALLAALAEHGWDKADSIAIGDGANDIPMIEAAGLGVAYHAKPKTRAAADASVDHGDLSVVRYAMGF